MLGPVLYLEMLLGGRRGRQMIFRWIYAGWLVLQLSFLWFIYWVQYQATVRGGLTGDFNATSRFATGFVEMFVVQQLILTLLITPAFAAGAITDEKTRGTLQYMLTAHLTAGEIVIGKLLGQMAQVGLLIIAGLPVLCFIGVFGGLHPAMMLAVFLVTVAPVFALGAASLLASVWARQTRDAVLSLYAAGALFLVAAAVSRKLATALPGAWGGFFGLIDAVFQLFSPLYVLEPGWGSGDLLLLFRRLVGSMLAWGGVGLACLGLAVWRLRSAFVKQLESTGKRRDAGALAPARPAIGEEPIRWKEREVEGIAPLATLRQIPLAAGMVLIFCLTTASSLLLLWLSMHAQVTLAEVGRRLGSFDIAGLAGLIDPGEAGAAFLVQSVIAMLAASLVVGIRCSGTVSGERERQTWEALLLTPLEAKQLIRGKLWGIFGAALPCLLGYALPAVVLSLLGGFQAFFWTVLWLAVTFLAMWYVGAAGVFCSVRSRTSWRALLATVGFGYLGGFIIYAATSPIIFIIALIIYIFLQLADNMYGLGLTKSVGPFGEFFTAFFVASCLALAAIFYAAAWYFIANAEKRVADRERTRHWKDDNLYRRGGRRQTAAPARYYP